MGATQTLTLKVGVRFSHPLLRKEVIGKEEKMGYIYKIINSVNDKIYVGMTKRTIEVRWREHMKAYDDENSRMYNFKIYQAMRELGINNFTPIMIEECNDENLEEREKYWIEYYDSVSNGYNTALGGYGKPLINGHKKKAMYELYLNGWVISEISKAINVNTSDIGEILSKEYSIDTKSNANKGFGKPIEALEIESPYKRLPFISISEAARYIVAQKKEIKVTSAISKISKSLDKPNKKPYGYIWKTIKT